MTNMTDRKNAAISRGVGMTTQIYADRAENAEIWDKEGNRYIDFAAGIAVVNTGHRHPRVIQAVKDQLPEVFDRQLAAGGRRRIEDRQPAHMTVVAVRFNCEKLGVQ